MTIRAQMRRSSTVSTSTKPDARMPRAWAVRNCLLAGPARPPGRTDPGVMQDLPHRGCRELVAEPDQLAVHPTVTPGRIARGDADHERADGGCRGRPPGTPPADIVPFACDEPVPGQQRRRGHGEHFSPALPGDQPGP